MKKIKLLSALAALSMPISLISVGCSQVSDGKIYRDINLDEDWKFKLNDQQNEQTINLPHDFSIIQDFKHTNRDLEHQQTSGTTGFLPGGIGYYHKDFVLPEKNNASIILNFDGSYNDTIVSVNGHIVGNNRYGYNPFAFDISKYAIADGQTVNELDVIVRHKYITSSRWYPGSGIYRDVKISVLDKLHVANNGTYVTTPNLEQEKDGDVTVNIEVEVQNSYNEAKSAYVRNRIVDASGSPVSDWSSTDSKTVNKQSNYIFNGSLKVNKPKLWSDKTPDLYYVETQVVSNNTVVDQYKTRFGFRYFKFDENGFWVNGVNTKLNGVCLHHDQGALGAAAYDDAIYRQLTIMKEMGMNAVRTSHNCPDEDLLRMCDELGLYVMDEAFDGWEFSKTSHDFGETWKDEIGAGNNLIDATPHMQWHSFVVRSMVKRDRNCPSIFMWSLGNELHEGAWHDEDISQEEKDRIKAEMLGFAEEMKNIAQELDHDPRTRRWCGIALERNPFDEEHQDSPKCKIGLKLYDEGGLLGFNYAENGWIDDAISKGVTRLYGSETASANNSRGVYSIIDDTNEDIAAEKTNDRFRVTSYDTGGRHMASQVIWQTLYYDGYAGQFVWTGFDYIGEPSPWCWNCEEDPVEEIAGKKNPETGEWELLPHWPYPNSAYYGIVDTCGFPKDSYYLYRANLRKDDTTLHLVGSLNENNMYKYPEETEESDGLPDGFTPVDIYTNAPYVEIKRDNTTIASVTRKNAPTSNGNGTYYVYETSIKDGDNCKAIELDSDIVHGLYTRIAVNPDGANEITAEAYESEEGQKIDNPNGLYPLVHMNNQTQGSINVSSNKPSITADGKSLAYVTVDLADAYGNLITDWDAQQELDITWSGNGDVLGVDNGNQATDEKFQSPRIYKIDGQNHAKIKTFAGKALIIVCSDKTPGKITLTIKKGETTEIKTLEIQTI